MVIAQIGMLTKTVTPANRLVVENPFRILGVYTGASVKEVAAAQARAKAFLKVGKPLFYPVDIGFPDINRTTEMYQQAVADTALPLNKMVHACFWFTDDGSAHVRAFFRALSEGDTERAVRFTLRDEGSLALRINLSVLRFLQQNYVEWFRIIADIIQSCWKAFTEHVCGPGVTVSPEEAAAEIIRIVRDQLSQGEFSLVNIASCGGLFGRLIEVKIREKILSLSESLGEGSDECRFARAMDIVESEDSFFSMVWEMPKFSVGLQRSLDSLASDMLQTSITLVNKGDGGTCLLNRSLELVTFLQKWKLGSQIKQRLQDSEKTLRDNILCEEEFESFSQERRSLCQIVNQCEAIPLDESLEYLYNHKDEIDIHFIRMSTIAKSLQAKKVLSELQESVGSVFVGIVANYYAEVPLQERGCSWRRKCQDLLWMTLTWPLTGEVLEVRDMILKSVKQDVDSEVLRMQTSGIRWTPKREGLSPDFIVFLVRVVGPMILVFIGGIVYSIWEFFKNLFS